MDLGMIEPVFKWAIFAFSSILAILGALMMVTRRNPIHSALWLIVAFFSLAVIYLTLHAQFIAVAQVMVYAGAIMMLIIFVIMLIQLEIESTRKGRVTGTKVIGAFITVILFLEVAAAFVTFPGNAAKPAAASVPAEAIGSVASVGTALYGKYLFPFEIASILLLVGVVGAVVLARRSKE
jgi:NADH-quinone oxidoreductase subunit J